MATRALAEAKGVLNRTGVNNDFGADMAEEWEAFQRLFVTDDAREGVVAFIEKRKAEFKGG
jgi:enoyl-CoA hydratase/carnithine racemase